MSATAADTLAVLSRRALELEREIDRLQEALADARRYERTLERNIGAALDLHVIDRTQGAYQDYCAGCGQPYPCRTRKALHGGDA